MARTSLVIALVFVLSRCVCATRRIGLEDADTSDFDAEVDMRFQSACAADGGRLWTEYEQLQRTENARVLVYDYGSWPTTPGLGNQFRGISVAFYVAMITKRAFKINWHQSQVAPNKIDWRLANGNLPKGCKDMGHYGKGGGVNCTRKESCNESRSELLHETTPCITLLTNAMPSIWFEHMARGPDSALLDPVNQAVAKPEFALGCAMNFLFDFSRFEKALAAERRKKRTGTPIVPSSYIALHMRWGDDHLKSPLWLAPVEKEKARAALACAKALGDGLFTKGEPWKVFVASDSSASRSYALEAAKQLNMSVYENEFAPMRAAESATKEKDGWSSWGDFLTLARVAGLVSAGGDHSAAGYGGVLTNGFSDYSQIPAQYQFLPFTSQRVVPNDLACKPVSPKDVQIII